MRRQQADSNWSAVQIELLEQWQRDGDFDRDAFRARYPGFSGLFDLTVGVIDGVEETRRARDEDVSWPNKGEQIDDYVVGEQIGQGAFAKVYEAVGNETGRRVILKVTDFETEEARHMAGVESEFVIPVLHTTYTDAGLATIVMPDRGRETLRDVMARSSRADAVTLALRVARDGGRGLADLHVAGKFHGDMKPDNMLLVEKTDGFALFDLNLTRVVQSPYTTGGTHIYLAPEQHVDVAQGIPAKVTEATDVYGLGAALFEIIAGHPPVDPIKGFDPSSKPAFPKAANAAEADLLRLIRACLSADPESRPSAGEVSAAAERHHTRRRAVRRYVADRVPQVTTCCFLLAVVGYGTAPDIADATPRWKTFMGLAVAEAAMLEPDRAFAAVRAAWQGRSRDEARFASKWLTAVNGRAGEAIDAISVYADETDSGEAAAAAAFCWHHTNDMTKVAIRYSEWAINRGYEAAEVYDNFAIFLALSGRYDDAEVAAATAERLDPTTTGILWTRLYVAYRRSVETGMSPDQELVKAGLARCESASPRQRETLALCVIEQARRGDVTVAEACETLGTIPLSRGSLEAVGNYWPGSDSLPAFASLLADARDGPSGGRFPLSDPFGGRRPGLDFAVFDGLTQE